MRWLHAGGDLSRHNYADQEPIAVETRYATTRMPIALVQPPLRPPIQVALCEHHAQLHDRREH